MLVSWSYMRWTLAGSAIALLTACSEPSDLPKQAAQLASSPGLVQKTVKVQGAPITVTWRQANPVEAEARGNIPPEQPVEAAATAIRLATGCRVPTEGVDFGKAVFFEADGNVRFTLGMDCSTKVAGTPQAGANALNQNDILLAAAVEEAVRAVVGNPTPRTPALAQRADAQQTAAVVAEPAVATTASQPSPEPAVFQPSTSAQTNAEPELYEGSPIAAFTPAQIQSYCQQDWTTRIAADGRTQYNPCTQRSAFR